MDQNNTDLVINIGRPDADFAKLKMTDSDRYDQQFVYRLERLGSLYVWYAARNDVVGAARVGY